MLNFRRSVLALALVAAFASGCSDSGKTVDLTSVTVDTVLDKAVVNEGESVTVQCVVTDPEGNTVDTGTLFSVAPAEGAAIDGDAVEFSKVGDYEVRCSLEDGTRADESPAEVMVTRNGVASIETKLDKSEIAAGEAAKVTCVVVGIDGEAVDVATVVTIDPEDGSTLEDHTITGGEAGEYDVTCATEDPPLLDKTPATLTVKPGAPAKVVAVIKEESIKAGEDVQVMCSVEDLAGNKLEAGVEVDSQEGLKTEGSKLTGEKAGEYDVTCSATDEELADLEKVSDHLIVTAADVAKLVLTPKPKKQVYQVGNAIAVEAEVQDSYGNKLEGYDVDITFPLGMTPQGDKHAFTKEGVFTILGQVEEPYESVKAELELICDQTGPVITVTTPERGATLNGDILVPVDGTVIDEVTDEVTLKINGVSVPVDDNGAFHHAVNAEHGLNILTFEAKDKFSNASKVVQSFYYSTGWIDYLETQVADVVLDDGLIVFLGQNFLDDGIHDPQQIDDIATLVEVLVGGLDLQQLVGDLAIVDTVLDNIVNYPFNLSTFEFLIAGDLGIKVFIEEITLGKPEVSLKTRNGGIDIYFGFNGTPENPSIGLKLFVQLQFTLSVSSSLGGTELFTASVNPATFTELTFSLEDAAVDVKLDINKDPGQDLTLDIADINVVLDGIHLEPISDLVIELGMIQFNGTDIYALPNIQLGQLISGINDILSDYVIDPVLNFVIPFLTDLIEPLIEWQVGPLLADVINQFELELPIPIPALPGQTQAVNITMKTMLSTVHFTDAGGTLGLAAGFWAPKGVDRDILGTILRMNCLGTAQSVPPVFDAAEKMQLAVQLDMVNELLFSIWWPGGLNLNLDESVLGGLDLGSFMISDLSVQTEFWLAPILDDCSAKEMVEIQIGDLLLTPSFVMGAKPLTLKVFASLSAEAVIKGMGNEIGLQILGEPVIGTQVAEVIGDPTAILGVNIVDLLENVLIPMIIEQVTNLSLGSFPIPEIDLGGLVPGIPAGTVLKLGNLEIKMSQGYLVIGGELQ